MLLAPLPTRVLSHELMDAPDLAPDQTHRALRGLARLNAFSGAARTLWRAIEPVARAHNPLSLLDIATGSADVPLEVARLAGRRGFSLNLAACDIRPEMRAAAAANAARRGQSLRLFAFDALRDQIPDQFDIITISLFTHHLENPAVVRLLSTARQATRRLLVVSDLHRTPVNLALVATTSRLITTSRIVHTDAVLSVRAAFSIPEMAALAAQAGLVNARITRAFPCRLLLTWSPPDA